MASRELTPELAQVAVEYSDSTDLPLDVCRRMFSAVAGVIDELSPYEARELEDYVDAECAAHRLQGNPSVFRPGTRFAEQEKESFRKGLLVLRDMRRESRIHAPERREYVPVRRPRESRRRRLTSPSRGDPDPEPEPRTAVPGGGR